MADNSTLPATGDVIATDDIAGVKHQLVKIEFGAADSATQVSSAAPLPTTPDSTKAEDAAHASGDKGAFILGVANQANASLAGTDGDYTPVSTDLHGIVDVHPRQEQYWFELNVPGYSTSAYLAGDQLGTLISITSAVRASGGTGWINSILYHDDDNVMGAIDVCFFNDTPSLAADNAAFAINDADARKMIAPPVQLSNVYALGAQRIIGVTGLSIPYFCTATTLYVALIQKTAPTLTGTTTQRIRFGLSRD